MAALATAVARGDRRATADFWREIERTGAPLIEPVPDQPRRRRVTFVFRGDDSTRNVLLFRGPNATMDLGANPLVRLAGTDVWYRSYVVGSDARFTYMLGRNIDLAGVEPKNMGAVMQRLAAFQVDPLNPRRFPTSGKAPPLYLNSVVELPDAPPDRWSTPDPAAPFGSWQDTTFASGVLHNERGLTIYRPAGWLQGGPGGPSRTKPADVLVLFDGPWYRSMVAMAPILDNLINARKIPPMVAILVANPGQTRGPELHCSREFTEFLATELLPWARKRHGVTDRPAGTVVAGSSAGGLAAVCAALHRPETFGKVLSMSGAFWWHPADSGATSAWLLDRWRERPRAETRFFLTAGLMEDAPQPEDRLSMLGLSRRLRDTLLELGYPTTYAEFDGGHEYLNWQPALAEGLIALYDSTGPSGR
jgi:enterochelin esterase family protein